MCTKLQIHYYTCMECTLFQSFKVIIIYLSELLKMIKQLQFQAANFLGAIILWVVYIILKK